MGHSNTGGGAWPSKDQELLLCAGLLRGPKAIESWERWQAGNDINEIDHGSFRVLPLVYRNLIAHGVDAPLLGKLRVIYRFSFYKNLSLWRRVTPVLLALQEAGIDTLVLKGAALAELYYNDWGQRPMGDADVLVPSAQIDRAVEVLNGLGWHTSDILFDFKLKARHSTLFRDAGDARLDLHWHPLAQLCDARASSGFWERAVPVEVGGVSTLTLDPTDHLLQVCLHGLASDDPAGFRWVADAAFILRAAHSEIEWPRLLHFVATHRLVEPLRHGLGYMSERFGETIPKAVLAQLNTLPVSKRERFEYQVNTAQGVGAKACRLWFQYSRVPEDRGAFFKLLDFPKYMQCTYNLRRLRDIPLHVLTRLMRDAR